MGSSKKVYPKNLLVDGVGEKRKEKGLQIENFM